MSALTSRLGSGDPRFCPELMRTLLHGHRYDGSLAERELGLAYTSLLDTVRRTLAWYADRGMAPAPFDAGPEPSPATDT